MSEKQQTAVEWLFDNLDLSGGSEAIETLNKAKKMEKEQIIRTHLMARCYNNENSVTEAEQYYNETFKSE